MKGKIQKSSSILMLFQLLTIAIVTSTVNALTVLDQLHTSPNCTNNGILLNKNCYCKPGFSGLACQVRKCFPACSTNGICEVKDNVAKCVCDEAFSGPSCKKSICSNNCFEKQGQGKCVQVPIEFNDGQNKKECYCSAKFTGRDCGTPRKNTPMPVQEGNGTNGTNGTVTPVVVPLLPIDTKCPTPAEYLTNGIYPGNNTDQHINYCNQMVTSDCGAMCIGDTRGRCPKQCDTYLHPDTKPTSCTHPAIYQDGTIYPGNNKDQYTNYCNQIVTADCGQMCMGEARGRCREECKRYTHPAVLTIGADDLEGQNCSAVWTDCKGCTSLDSFCGTPSGNVGQPGGQAAVVTCGLDSCTALIPDAKPEEPIPGDKPDDKPDDKPVPANKPNGTNTNTNSNSLCPGDDGPCNGNGICDSITQQCTCNPGWYGNDCNELPCPQNCYEEITGDNDESHGQCLNDKCVCKPAWEGKDCGTPTSIRMDLPCAQDCPGDCEHAAECDQYNLRYWVPVFHTKTKTTDRIYSWVTPKTGHNHQWQLHEAKQLGHAVPDTDNKQAYAARKCYLGCVRTCASRCFYALHGLTDIQRDAVGKTQKLSKRLPGITGDQVVDETFERELKAAGKKPGHPDYSPEDVIAHLKKMTKITEGGVSGRPDKGNTDQTEINDEGDNTFYDGINPNDASGPAEEDLTTITQTLTLTGVSAAAICTDAGKSYMKASLVQMFDVEDASTLQISGCIDTATARRRRLLGYNVEVEYKMQIPKTAANAALLTKLLDQMQSLCGEMEEDGHVHVKDNKLNNIFLTDVATASGVQKDGLTVMGVPPIVANSFQHEPLDPESHNHEDKSGNFGSNNWATKDDTALLQTKGDDGQAYWLPPASGDESAGGGGGAAPASPGTSQYSVSPQAFYQGGGAAGAGAAPAKL